MAVRLAMSHYERNLQHWLPEGRSVFLTWRLQGSLPQGLVSGLQRLAKEPGKQFMAADRRLDSAATGPRWLNAPEIAGYAEAAILREAELRRFVLHVYVVMPNHDHILLDPLAPLKRFPRGIKAASAPEANRALRRTGKAFWQDESFDHWIRGNTQFERIRA
jgi:putative transposase